MEKNRVVLYETRRYQIDELKEKTRSAIDSLGGMQALFGSKTNRILLKPNFLRPRDKDAHLTTRPEVFAAVAEVLLEAGYTNLSYGDSPAVADAGCVAKACGILEQAERLGIQFVDFEQSTAVTSKHNRKFPIARPVLECDVIVNLAKMKAHQLTRITGCVKNLYGCVSGKHKGLGHVKNPTASSFGAMLLDLYETLQDKIAFNVLDGIVAMEGNGPANGDPIAMHSLLFSTDAIAADRVFCALIDLDCALVPYLSPQLREKPEQEAAEISLIGTPIETLKNPAFRVNRTQKQERTGRFYDAFVRERPCIEQSLCLRCGLCQKSCPQREKGALQGKAGQYPSFNYSRCIRCYCCQEVCPAGAIYRKTPFLSKFFGG